MARPLTGLLGCLDALKSVQAEHEISGFSRSFPHWLTCFVFANKSRVDRTS